TLGTPSENVQRFGGDRPAAFRSGLPRPWRTVQGLEQAQFGSAADLIASGLVQGLAAWGSPAPGPGSGIDTDVTRGITDTPDEGPLWEAWSATGATAEARNRGAGVSDACQALRTPALAPAVAHDSQYFAQTGFRVDDRLNDFIVDRGGISTFG